jgi:hypothetical protein
MRSPLVIFWRSKWQILVLVRQIWMCGSVTTSIAVGTLIILTNDNNPLSAAKSIRSGAVPSLAVVAVEVSDYPPLVANVSQARIKVCVVHDPRPRSNSPRPQHVVLFITRTHHTLLVYSIGAVVWVITRSYTRTEVGFTISSRRTSRTKWEHTVGPSVVLFPRRGRPGMSALSFPDGIQVCQFTRCVGVVCGAEVVYC